MRLDSSRLLAERALSRLRGFRSGHGGPARPADGAPQTRPDRAQRPDVEFLTNLPLTQEVIVSRLREAFGAERELKEWPGNGI